MITGERSRGRDAMRVPTVHYQSLREDTCLMAQKLKSSAVNSMTAAQFQDAFGAVFEHSPWVAERAYARRPFRNLDALHRAMMDAVREAPPDQQLALIRVHPELAGREADTGTLTADSTGEQGRLGFTALPRAEYQRMAELNRRYREKFGFPYIVALRRHATQQTVFEDFERRLGNDMETEIANALDEIGHITRGRIEALVEDR
jgi:2-oxo-4-hydroxy-4-carboxy-5-ureidoimidazoline decarboxylase